MSETKSSTTETPRSKGESMTKLFGNIGAYVRYFLGGFETSFRDGSQAGNAGRFLGRFSPEARLFAGGPLPPCSESHLARYGVHPGGDNVGPAMGSEIWSPEPIEFLLRHPSNPLSLTPEAISEMLTPPINGTRVWQEAKLDLSAVIVNGQPAFFAVQNMAKALGYGAAPPAAQPSQAVTYGLTYVLTPLAPVEQRAGEIANLVEDAWNRDAPSWVRQIIPGSFVGNLAESVALIAIPIWRRAQERIAQRTAEILREGGK